MVSASETRNGELGETGLEVEVEIIGIGIGDVRGECGGSDDILLLECLLYLCILLGIGAILRLGVDPEHGASGFFEFLNLIQDGQGKKFHLRHHQIAIGTPADLHFPFINNGLGHRLGMDDDVGNIGLLHRLLGVIEGALPLRVGPETGVMKQFGGKEFGLEHGDRVIKRHGGRWARSLHHERDASDVVIQGTVLLDRVSCGGALGIGIQRHVGAIHVHSIEECQVGGIPDEWWGRREPVQSAREDGIE